MPSLPFFSSGGGTASLQAHAIRAAHDVLANMTSNLAGSELLPFVLHDNPHLDITTRAGGFGDKMSVNASQILLYPQRRQTRYLATATSTVSITAALCAVYWFCLMRRNFRRDLVLMLILGDFWKSLWFLAYSVATFVNGPLQTHTKFCQAGGYLLTWGIESCDIAILFMSMHMALQIFPPKDSWLGHDGLYRLRHWVVAAWFVVPNVMASLAFVNSGPAFQATGAFCTLPIRPFWYRLALSWIPRYLIWIYIMCVAIKIYRHVGKEFAVFGHEKDGSSGLTQDSSVDRSQVAGILSSRRKSTAPSNFDLERQATSQIIDEEEVAPDDETTPAQSRSGSQTKFATMPEQSQSMPSSRRPSAPNWSAAFNFSTEPLSGPMSLRSASSSRRGSRVIVSPGVMGEDFATAMGDVNNRHRPSVVTMNSIRSSMNASTIETNPALPPIREDKRNSGSAASGNAPAANIANKAMRSRRRAIQRQLRLLFIYPVVYMMLWLIPFVFHCFNYSDHYAQHPIFVLSILNIFCQCFLGTADVCIFCWRERPWKHVPGSDGTLLGSFCFWRFWKANSRARRESKAPSYVPSPETTQDEKRQSQAGLLEMFRRWSISLQGGSPRPSDTSAALGAPRSTPHRRTRSGGSDRKHREIDQAHERLALERADYEKNKKSLDGRQQSMIDMQQSDAAGSAPQSPRKEWWDKQLEDDPMHDEKEGSEHQGVER